MGSELNNRTEAKRSASRRTRRWMLIALAAVFVMLAVAVMILPAIVNTESGKGFVLDLVNRSIHGRIELDKLRVGWLSGQSIDGFTLRDADDNVVISNARLDAPDTTLLAALFGSRNYGQIKASVDEIHVRQSKDGPTNLEQSVSSRTSGTRKSQNSSQMGLPADMNLDLEFTAKRITYESPGLDRIENENVKASVRMSRLSTINMSLESDVTQAGQRSRLQADIQIDDAFDQAGNPQIDKARIKADVQLPNLPVEAVDQISGSGGRISALLGPKLDVNLKADGNVGDLNARLVATSQYLNADLQLGNDHNRLKVKKGSAVNLQLTPQAYDVLAGIPADASQQVRLLRPVDINVYIDQAGIDQRSDQFDLRQLALDAGLTMSEVTWVSGDSRHYVIRNLAIQFDKTSGQDDISAALRAVAGTAGEAQPVEFKLTAKNVFGDTDNRSLVIDAVDLPVGLVDSIAGLDGRMAELAGSVVNTKVELQADRHGDYTFRGNVKSDRLSGNINGVYQQEEGILQLDNSSSIDLNVSPAAFDNLLGRRDENGVLIKPAMTLEKNMPVRVSVEEFELAANSVAGGKPVDTKRTRIDMDINIPHAVMRDSQTNQRIVIEQSSLSVDATDIRKFIDLLAKVNVKSGEVEEVGKPGGQLFVKARLRDVVDSAGRLQPGQAHVDAEGDIRAMPSSLFDTMLRQDGKLAAVLGPQTSAAVKVNYQQGRDGQIDLDVKADNVTSRIAAGVNPDGLIKLREDAIMTLSVTPQMAQTMLGHIHPVFADAVASETPATMVISKDEFEMPAKRFKIQKLAAQGSIDPGVLRMNREGWLDQGIDGLMSSVFTQSGRRSKNPDQPKRIYLTKFTPVSFTIKRGIVRCSELWMTSEDLAVGFQGSINLKNGKIKEMTMGLLEVSLAIRNPSMAPFVKPTHIADLPISGPITSPKVHYDVFATDIAGAMASNIVREQAGEMGAIFIDIIGDAIKEDRRKKTNLIWNPPQEAVALVDSYYKQQQKAAAKQQTEGDNKRRENQQSQQDQQQQKQPLTIYDLIDQLQDD